MTYKLVVLKPFQGFRRGDVISDQAAIARVLAGGHAASVVRIAADKS